jgi:hypothetical protein
MARAGRADPGRNRNIHRSVAGVEDEVRLAAQAQPAHLLPLMVRPEKN